MLVSGNAQSVAGLSGLELLDGLVTGILLLDKKGRLLYMNNAAEGFFDVSAKRFLGRSAKEFLGMETVLQGAVMAAIGGHTTTFREVEIRKSFLYENDETVRINCTISPFFAGPKISWVVAEIATAEPLGREAEWREQKSATHEIVRALAHEIKNPLGGLRGAAQLLDRRLNVSELKDYTKIIIDEADRLAKLVDRMVSPRKSLVSKEFNLHEALERVRYLIEVEFGTELNVTRDYDPSIPDFRGQKEYLIQAFLNVARNAAQSINGSGQIKFRTRVQRQLTVAGRRHRHVLEATITDFGPGIPKEIQDKIFLPMITGRIGGTGLGLTLSQEIVGNQGGTIECVSNPGETRFTFLLPVYRSDDE